MHRSAARCTALRRGLTEDVFNTGFAIVLSMGEVMGELPRVHHPILGFSLRIWAWVLIERMLSSRLLAAQKLLAQFGKLGAGWRRVRRGMV
jgi:hypothetical protein